MTYIENVIQRIDNISFDAAGKQRVSQGTTLLDGKIINEDNTLVWDNIGTGTGTWIANKYAMSVTSGQYRIRQTKRFYPYFTGKSQIIDCTFDGSNIPVNTELLIGYFSSSTVAPYNTAYDGFCLRNNGVDKFITVYRNGTTVANIPMTSWDNYSAVATYDWSKFTVIAFDFLWLGGTALRFFMKLPGKGFELIHTYHYAGNEANTFIQSPNQPIRYELRSTGGATSFNYVCSTVSTEGAINESGYGNSVRNTTLITANTVGVIYVLKGIRKKLTHRDTPIRISNFSINITASADSGIAMLVVNPTLSAAVTFTDLPNSGIQDGTATNQTVTALGRVIASTSVTQSGGQSLIQDDFLCWLGDSINGTRDEIYLVYLVTTANQTVNGIINVKEY